MTPVPWHSLPMVKRSPVARRLVSPSRRTREDCLNEGVCQDGDAIQGIYFTGDLTRPLVSVLIKFTKSYVVARIHVVFRNCFDTQSSPRLLYVIARG